MTTARSSTSIDEAGLDWYATGPGGEHKGRLGADLESAEWFARMGAQRGHTTDIWAIRLDGMWLVGDPNASNGGDDGWMICPEPIPPDKLELVRLDNDFG